MSNKILYIFGALILILFPDFLPGQESAITKIGTDSKQDSIAIVMRQLKQSGDPMLRTTLARLYIEQEQFDEAEAQFNLIAEIDSLKIVGLTGLGQVHYYRGPSKIIPFERLKELFKKDHYSKAIKQFNQALEIDEKYFPARYYLGMVYQKKGKPDNLQKARDIFTDLNREAPEFRDVYYQLGYTYLLLENYGQALKIFQKFNENHKDYARASIRKAEVYYEIGNPKKSTESYFQGIETLVDAELLDELYNELKMLLSPEEKDEFESVDSEESRSLFKKFWKRRDPDPSTPENERLMEHFRRVNHARELFHFTAPPYYDDRGKIYIKYGPPDDRYNSQLGSLPAKDNESWTYESIEKGLVFDFVSEGGYFRQVEDLTEAAIAGYSYDSRLYLASQLYYNRSHLSQAYANLSVGFTWDRLNNYHSERAEALEKYPGEIYRHDYKAERFPFLTKWAQFRGDSSKTRIELYTSFPGIAVNFEKQNGRFVNFTDFYIEAQDSNYDSAIKNHDRFSIELESLDNMPSRQFIFQQNYQIEPGVYDFSFVINSKDQTRKGVKKETVRIRNFNSDALMLSDIQLSSGISAETKESNATFVKNELAVTPYTFSRVMKSRPIHVYFEIYNLAMDQDGNSNFEIAYTVKTIEPHRNFWQKTVGSIPRLFAGKDKNIVTTSSIRIGDSRDAVEYIAFDLKNLDNGVTELKIHVTDKVTNQYVEDIRQFTLFE